MKLVIFLICAATLLTQNARASGNGSSGVGNQVPIGGELFTVISSSQSISRKGAYMIDGKTGEKLLRLDSSSERN